MIPIKKLIPYSVIALILIAAFLFRLIGIGKGLSYWNDENHVALMSRGILEYGKPVTAIGVGNGIYQLAYYYLTAIFFLLLGVNEFAGRLPSVIAGTLFVGIMFVVTKKIVGERAAYIAAFLAAFSQIQLAWSTQLRPYIWLEIATLLVTYFCYKTLQNKNTVIDKSLCYASLTALVAALFHGTGLISIMFVGIIIVTKSIIHKKYAYMFAILPIGLLAMGVIYFSSQDIFSYITTFNLDILHYRIFLTHNYLWLLVGAALGTIFLFKRDKILAALLVGFISCIFFVAIFKLNNRYVRYSLPAFPLLYILFSAGVIALSDYLSGFSKNKVFKILIPIMVLSGFFAFPILKGKILLQPKHYYTINGDMRENPIVDYKYAFEEIKKRIQHKDNVILMDAWNDRIPYYLPGQKFILLIKDGKGKIDPHYGEKMIGTIKEYEAERKKYPSGVVVVENWESLTPPELQEHIRKTLKHEFTVDNLPYNENDKWSISIYSWGM